MSHPSGDWERAADLMEALSYSLQSLLEHLSFYRTDFNEDDLEFFVWRLRQLSMEAMKVLEDAHSKYEVLPRSSLPLRSPDAPPIGGTFALPNYCEGVLQFGWKIGTTLSRAKLLTEDGAPKLEELAALHRRYCLPGPNGSRDQLFRNISSRLLNELRINSARLAGTSYHVTESDDGQTSVTLHTPELKAIGQQKLAGDTWPPDDGWHFRDGEVWFRRTCRLMSSKDLWTILKLLTSASASVNRDAIRSVIDPHKKRYQTDKAIDKKVSDLRKWLVEEFGLPGEADPIPVRRGFGSYTLARELF